MEDTFERIDNSWMASEPAVDYNVAGSGYEITMQGRDNLDSEIPVGKCGFYTEDPNELQSRIADIERSIDKAELGDESEWLTAEDFDKELYREFLWLQ